MALLAYVRRIEVGDPVLPHAIGKEFVYQTFQQLYESDLPMKRMIAGLDTTRTRLRFRFVYTVSITLPSSLFQPLLLDSSSSSLEEHSRQKCNALSLTMRPCPKPTVVLGGMAGGKPRRPWQSSILSAGLQDGSGRLGRGNRVVHYDGSSQPI